MLTNSVIGDEIGGVGGDSLVSEKVVNIINTYTFVYGAQYFSHHTFGIMSSTTECSADYGSPNDFMLQYDVQREVRWQLLFHLSNLISFCKLSLLECNNYTLGYGLSNYILSS